MVLRPFFVCRQLPDVKMQNLGVCGRDYGEFQTFSRKIYLGFLVNMNCLAVLDNGMYFLPPPRSYITAIASFRLNPWHARFLFFKKETRNNCSLGECCLLKVDLRGLSNKLFILQRSLINGQSP